jgi:hypothetical protein
MGRATRADSNTSAHTAQEVCRRPGKTRRFIHSLQAIASEKLHKTYGGLPSRFASIQRAT